MVAAAVIPLPAAGAMSRDLSDQQLLAQYVRERDEAAFVELVRRHSRTVWGVCRRLVASQEDAEDAFQAVFTILSRKASAIRKGDSVGSWLYGVAYRTAQRARHQACERRQRETQVRPAAPEPPAWCDAACRELQRMLDAEVQRLSAKHRAPFVLCCLEWMSKSEAARELGWKEGTVSGRLSQARKLLETRLARRGVVLSAVLTATALAQQSAAAAPPTALVQATASALLPHAGAATVTLSPQALTLAHGVIQTMAVTKLAAVASIALAASVLIGGVSLAAVQDDPQPQAPAPPQAVPIPAPPQAFPPQPVGPVPVMVGEPVMTLAFSPDGKRLVTASNNQGAGRPVAVAPAAGVQDPGGAAGIVVAGPPGAPGAANMTFTTPAVPPGHLRIWDVDSGKLINEWGGGGVRDIRSLAFSPDGSTLALARLNGELRLQDAEMREVKAKVQAHAGGVNCVAFSADGTLLVTAGLDGTVKIWEVAGLKLRKTLLGHTDRVLTVAFFRHGRSVVSGSRDKTARIWDIETGTTTYVLQGHNKGIETVAVSPDDKLVATASWDKIARLWEPETGKELTVLNGANGALFGAAFSPDGSVLVAGLGNGRICIWDVKTRSLAGTLQGHTEAVWAVGFSPAGKRLASGSSDGTVRIWDMATRRQIATLAIPQPAYFVAPQGVLPQNADQQRFLAEVQRLQVVQSRDGVVWRVAPPVAVGTGTDEAAKSGSKLWLLSILAMGLVTSYLAFWFYVRHTRRTAVVAQPNRPTASRTALPAAPLLFACTSCGKRLRVRAELSGKKVKCPQCGEAVPVPGSPVDLAIRPAT